MVPLNCTESLKGITGFRDIFIHEYTGIDYGLLSDIQSTLMTSESLRDISVFTLKKRRTKNHYDKTKILNRG